MSPIALPMSAIVLRAGAQASSATAPGKVISPGRHDGRTGDPRHTRSTTVNRFSADPPNAVLSFLDEDGTAPDDVVIVLREPRLKGETLTYSVEILDGTLPERSGPCSLFIDVFGRPLSPVSAAGAGRPKRRKGGAAA